MEPSRIVAESSMSSRYREPRLEDMLADSIVKAVMEADGVDPRELEAELRQTAALLRPIRLTPISPEAPQESHFPISPIDQPSTDDPP
jgi:hypothetical protein